MRLFSRVLAVATVLPLVGQVPDIASHLARQQQPILLILAATEPSAAKPVTARDLLEADGLEEVLRWVVISDPKNAGSVQLNGAYRSHLKLPTARWALVAPGGVCVASGTKHLDVVGLKAALEAARIQTPIQKLRAFLRRRPDHLEARQKLLPLLRKIAERRTHMVLGASAFRKPLPPKDSKQILALRDTLPKPGAMLSAEQDLRIWSDTYLEFSRAYKSGDWLAMSLPPEPAVGNWVQRPSAFPAEAASPLMRGLFRQHRNTLLATLRDIPDDLNVLHHWLWTSLVLEEPLIPVFEGLKTPSPFINQGIGGKSWPGEPVHRAMAAEAAANQDWPRLRRMLISRWVDGADVRRMNRNSSYASPDLEQWQELALPALEACLRSGAPNEADPVLEGAMEAKEAGIFLAEAVALARRMGRADVATAWGMWSPRPALPEHLWSPATAVRSVKDPRDFRLNYSFKTAEGQINNTYLISPIRLHPEDPKRSNKSDAWSRFLGWGSLELRWAVVGKKGQVLLQGAEPMDENAVEKEIEGLNLPVPGGDRDKLQEAAWIEAANDPWLRLELAIEEIWGYQRSLQSAEQRRKNQLKQNRTTSSGFEEFLGAQEDPWRLRRLEPVLNEGLWLRAGWRAGGYWHGSYNQPGVSPAESIARPWVEALEAALIRCPTRTSLWCFWAQWIKFLPEHPIQPFLDRLELDPLVQPSPWENGYLWPPDEVLAVLIARAQVLGRWDLLEGALRPFWREDLRKLERLGSSAQGGVGAHLAERTFKRSGLPLAQALHQQGRSEEADRVLEEALQAGIPSRQNAAQQAAFRDFKELAERWDPQPQEPAHR